MLYPFSKLICFSFIFKLLGPIEEITYSVMSYLWVNVNDVISDSLSLGQNVNINLAEIIPVIDYHAMGSFYRYKGGLTTPGCDQVVQWTVFQNPLYISRAQVSMLDYQKTQHKKTQHKKT